MRRLSVVLSAGLSFACSQHYEDDLFYVRNLGADMPVAVREDAASGSVLVFIHGGPGASSVIGLVVPAFRDLEWDHVVASCGHPGMF